MKIKMNKINKFFANVISLLIPKYHSVARYKFALFFYEKFGHNKKEVYDKLNKKYCDSFFKIFKTLKFERSDDKTNKNLVSVENAVFVYWNTGLNSMPKIVKMCYENLVKTTTLNVVLIDSHNIKRYSTIPEKIYSLVDKKIISYTLFSDLLRINLLSIHKNCIWLDATCFLYKDFPKDIFSNKFLTVYPGKNKSIFFDIPRFYYAPDLKIGQSYFLFGEKNIFFKFYQLLLNYLLQESKFRRKLRPYYLTYYVFEYLYETDSEVTEAVDSRRDNNDLVETIEGKLNCIYKDCESNKYFDDITFIYKLSYKMEFHEFVDGQLTNFGYLLHSKGIYDFD